MKLTRTQRPSRTITITVRDRGATERLVRTTRATLGAAASFVGRGVGAVRVTTDTAAGTTTTLQGLPDATLLGLAAASVGMGTGFYLARKSRLVVALGVVPALLAGLAIVLRPMEPAKQAPVEP